jgi:hypothetical protein
VTILSCNGGPNETVREIRKRSGIGCVHHVGMRAGKE